MPLPWNLTNPWLFFDGKLFHLKLRMAVSLQNLRELCDDQLDMVMKVERFRKAILEDIENLLPFGDSMYQRPVYQQNTASYALYGQNSKNIQIQPPIHGANNYPYGSIQQQMFYASNINHPYGINQQRQVAGKNQMQTQKNLRGGQIGYQKNNGYQLKVAGVVVGSWANRSQAATRVNRAGMVRRNKTKKNQLRP